MNCNDYKILIFEYFDKTISGEDEILLKEHLQNCPDCKKELEELERLDSILKYDSKEILDKKEYFFQKLENFTINQIFFNKEKKKWHLFDTLKLNYAFSSFIFVFFFAAVFYLSFYSFSTKKVEVKGDTNLELKLFSTDYDDLYYSIPEENLFNSDYFKDEIKLLNESHFQLFPKTESIFNTFNDIPQLDEESFDEVINQLANKSFI